jgi:putative SOS response-associated peptidase YedK
MVAPSGPYHCLTFHARSRCHFQIFLTVQAPRVVRSLLASEFVREIHPRMPVILPEERHDAWLSGEAGREVLVPYPAGRMKAWPVSSRVNSPKNDDAEIIVPVEFESVSGSENSPRLL